MIDSSLQLLAVPLVVGLVQVAKMSNINERLIPVLTILIGILSVALLTQNPSWDMLLNGVVAGLGAMGLWTGTKVTMAIK